MILIVLAVLCVIAVPLTGGDLGRLADLRLRGLWLPIAAIAIQVVITVIATGGSPLAHRLSQIASYVVIGTFLWLNRRVAGARVVTLGAALNALAIILNGGVMPASRRAERLSGLVLHGGFHNSTPVAHPVALFLGDIIPWPGPLPNVLSVGDLIIFTGMFVLLHRTCGRRAAGPRPAPPLIAPTRAEE